jgi:hypothetical protein
LTRPQQYILVCIPFIVGVHITFNHTHTQRPCYAHAGTLLNDLTSSECTGTRGPPTHTPRTCHDIADQKDASVVSLSPTTAGNSLAVGKKGNHAQLERLLSPQLNPDANEHAMLAQIQRDQRSGHSAGAVRHRNTRQVRHPPPTTSTHTHTHTRPHVPLGDHA